MIKCFFSKKKSSPLILFSIHKTCHQQNGISQCEKYKRGGLHIKIYSEWICFSQNRASSHSCARWSMRMGVARLFQGTEKVALWEAHRAIPGMGHGGLCRYRKSGLQGGAYLEQWSIRIKQQMVPGPMWHLGGSKGDGPCRPDLMMELVLSFGNI